MKAYLLLANGMVFEGRAFGAAGTSVGEVVFNTGMVGYEETLTDPSYYGQIITQTYPLVGNYGVNGEDAESARIWAFGYIVRELCGTPSNFRCQKTLDEFLKEQGIIGIAGVDTRRLTRIIRESGVMNGALTTEYKSADAVRADAALMEKIKAYTVKDAVDSVTTKCMETFNENGKYHVALFDFGYKRNILRNLVKRGCKVTLVPGRSCHGRKNGKAEIRPPRCEPAGDGFCQGPHVHNQPEPRLCRCGRYRGPRRGRGEPCKRQRRYHRGHPL